MAQGQDLVPGEHSSGFSVDDLTAAYWRHAEVYYRNVYQKKP